MCVWFVFALVLCRVSSAPVSRAVEVDNGRTITLCEGELPALVSLDLTNIKHKAFTCRALATNYKLEFSSTLGETTDFGKIVSQRIFRIGDMGRGAWTFRNLNHICDIQLTYICDFVPAPSVERVCSDVNRVECCSDTSAITVCPAESIRSRPVLDNSCCVCRHPFWGQGPGVACPVDPIFQPVPESVSPTPSPLYCVDGEMCSGIDSSSCTTAFVLNQCPCLCKTQVVELNGVEAQYVSCPSNSLTVGLFTQIDLHMGSEVVIVNDGSREWVGDATNALHRIFQTELRGGLEVRLNCELPPRPHCHATMKRACVSMIATPTPSAPAPVISCTRHSCGEGTYCSASSGSCVRCGIFCTSESITCAHCSWSWLSLSRLLFRLIGAVLALVLIVWCVCRRCSRAEPYKALEEKSEPGEGEHRDDSLYQREGSRIQKILEILEDDLNKSTLPIDPLALPDADLDLHLILLDSLSRFLGSDHRIVASLVSSLRIALQNSTEGNDAGDINSNETSRAVNDNNNKTTSSIGSINTLEELESRKALVHLRLFLCSQAHDRPGLFEHLSLQSDLNSEQYLKLWKDLQIEALKPEPRINHQEMIRTQMRNPFNADEEIYSVSISKIIQSANRPAVVNVNTTPRHGPRGGKVRQLLVKQGDDLRIDQGIMTVFMFLNHVWKSNDIRYDKHDAQALVYSCLPLGQLDSRKPFGLIEYVSNVIPLKDIKKWDRTGKKSGDGPMPLFLATMAGATAAHILLGIRDRHLDNFLVTGDGRFFLIDFGFVFEDRPFLDTGKIAIQESAVSSMGKLYFKEFVRLTVKALMCLRSGDVYPKLLKLAEIVFANTKYATTAPQFIRSQLRIQQDSEIFGEELTSALEKAPHNYWTKLKNRVHG